jgi:hypothetical protein
LRREVTDDVGQVTTPEAEETLLSRNADEAIDHALVLLILRKLFGGMLHLKQTLHSLDRSDSGLGDSGGNATSDEVLGERNGIGQSHCYCT